MKTYRVQTRETREAWATVQAKSLEQAIHLAKVSLSLEEEQADDDVDTVDWDFPQPIDIIDVEIVLVRDVTGTSEEGPPRG